MPGINFQNVSFSYQKDAPVLQGLDFSIQKGSFVGIAGNNGSGKSTLLYLINSLIPHHTQGFLQGKVLVDGFDTKVHNLSFFSSLVGTVFQNPEFSIFNLTVKEEIAFGLKNQPNEVVEQKIKQALEVVNLQGFEERDPSELSLGQKQRLSLAAVLAMDTDYIILDEPSSMLDYKSSKEIYRYLKKINQEQNKTIITIEHDTSLLYQHADQILILDKGKKVLFDTPDKVFKEPKNREILEEICIRIPV